MNSTESPEQPITSAVVSSRSVDQESAGEPGGRWTRLLCTLFFFSGFPALIYQLVWQRALFRIFGVNIESVTIVVTAFMLGLGLGSLAGGWLSKRRNIPLLLLLATIELLTGSFGIVSLGVFDKVGVLALGMPLPVIGMVALALVALPTLLMGATLPVLVGHLANRSGNVGSSVGRLYYVNTLGAGAACLISTVLLFPFLGMQMSVYLAVSMNVMVALGALGAYWRSDRATSSVAVDQMASVAKTATLRFAPVTALAFTGGFISLSYEVFFVRTLSYATGGSATAFSVTLGAFLIGLASGSRQAGDWCATSGDDAPRRVVGSLLKANLVGLLFLPLLAHLAWLERGLLGVALLMVYVFARYWGTLLPCLAHLGVTPDDRAGMRTALLYLANIAGSAVGSVLTGFVLMDRLSLVQIATVLVGTGLTCGLLLAAALPATRRAKWRQAGLAVAVGALIVPLLPAVTSGVLEALLWKGSPDAKGQFTHVIENRSGIITVDRTGTVYGNGMYDGRFNTDLMNDTNGIVRPYALSLFHRQPRDVLMIGLASGSWAQVIANNPQVASLTIVEINPGYLQLLAQTPEVASVLTNPKVHIVTDDGRRWLLLNAGRRFDVVVSNTTWYFRANATNLLSSEFLTLVKAHLKPDGVFFYNTTDSERVQRTGCLAFPYGARFSNHMVVSLSPLNWDFENWHRTLDAYRIDGRPVLSSESRQMLDGRGGWELLKAKFTATDASSHEQWVESCSRILARTAGRAPVTDDNMGSEWRHDLGLE